MGSTFLEFAVYMKEKYIFWTFSCEDLMISGLFAYAYINIHINVCIIMYKYMCGFVYAYISIFVNILI